MTLNGSYTNTDLFAILSEVEQLKNDYARKIANRQATSTNTSLTGRIVKVKEKEIFISFYGAEPICIKLDTALNSLQFDEETTKLFANYKIVISDQRKIKRYISITNKK